MLLQTQISPFVRARTVNQTSNGYVSKIPTITEPAADTGSATASAAISLTDAGARDGAGYNGVLIMPYAIGSDDNTFSMRVIGWRTVGEATNGVFLWIPVLLCELACTCSTVVGIAGREVLNTERFADTITITYGNANVSVEAFSPANNVTAHAIVDLKGNQKFELSFTTGGSATSCNALWAPM